MQGFFQKEDLSGSPAGKKVSGCSICRLYKTCHSPRMPVTGKGKLKILVVAEAPGKEEDKNNIQLIGKAGQTFRKILREFDLDLDRDFWKTNALICRPPDNATPTPTQLEACRPNLIRTINELKPQAIWILGGSSLDTFLTDRTNEEGGITKWRGLHIPDRITGAWLCPMLHPSFLNYEQTSPVVRVLFKRDISSALKILDKPFPAWKEEQQCVQVLSQKEAAFLLSGWIENDTPREIAIDFETTGRKPQQEGHRIVCASIATDDDKAFSFPVGKIVREDLIRVLQEPKIRKIGHNIKFEQIWSKVILGTGIRGWVWDTMVGARLLNNQRGTSGLKFLAFAMLGTPDYSSGIESYLKVNDRNGNAFNRILDADRQKLLQYNAIDSLVTFRIAKIQRTRKEFRED